MNNKRRADLGKIHPYHRRSRKIFPYRRSKLRKLAEENPVPDWVMMNGNRIQIKRKQFEKMIDTVDAI